MPADEGECRQNRWLRGDLAPNLIEHGAPVHVRNRDGWASEIIRRNRACHGAEQAGAEC